MGLLDDAIREHLDLKRRRGADPAEIERAEREALGPVRRDPLVSEEAIRAESEGLVDDRRALPGHDDDLAAGFVDETESEAAPEPGRERRGSGGRSLFGRLRREPAAPEPEEEPHLEEQAHDPLDDRRHTFDEHLPGTYDEEWDGEDLEDEYELYDAEEAPADPGHAPEPGTVAFRRPDGPDVAPAAEGAPPAPHRAPAPPAGAPGEDELGETAEYDVESSFERPAGARGRPAPEPEAGPAPEAKAEDEDEDVLEETPEFLQDTPDHDRLWFEQRPPRDFDFDG